jgi:hypothetical protein
MRCGSGISGETQVSRAFDQDKRRVDSCHGRQAADGSTASPDGEVVPVLVSVVLLALKFVRNGAIHEREVPEARTT